MWVRWWGKLFILNSCFVYHCFFFDCCTSRYYEILCVIKNNIQEKIQWTMTFWMKRQRTGGGQKMKKSGAVGQRIGYQRKSLLCLYEEPPFQYLFVEIRGHLFCFASNVHDKWHRDAHTHAHTIKMAIINFFCLFFVIFGWLVGLVFESETASSTKKVTSLTVSLLG